MRNISPHIILEILTRNITSKDGEPKTRDLKNAVIDFVELASVKRFLQPFSEESQLNFMKYAMLYMNLYLPSTDFSIEVTDRYVSKSSTKEACVVSRSPLNKGQIIKGLEAWSANVDQDDLDNFNGPDFSMINHENGTGSFLLGPARFVNHSCEPNAGFKYRGRRISIVATKPIEPGQEITVNYGKRYFGRFNRECLCLTCEVRGVNGYGEPLITDENDSSSSEEEGDGEEEEEEEEEAGHDHCTNNDCRHKDQTVEVKPSELPLKRTRRSLTSPPKATSVPSSPGTASSKKLTKTIIDLDTPSPSPSPRSSSPAPKTRNSNHNRVKQDTITVAALPDTPVSSANSPSLSAHASGTESTPPPQLHPSRCTRNQAKIESQKKVVDFFDFQFPDDDEHFTNTQVEWDMLRIHSPEISFLDYIITKLAKNKMYVDLQGLYYREAIEADSDLTLDCDNCNAPFFGPDDSKPPRIFPDRLCPRCNRHAALYNSYWPSFEKVPGGIELKHPWDFSNMKNIGVRGNFIPPEDDKKSKHGKNSKHHAQYSSDEASDAEDAHPSATRGRKRKHHQGANPQEQVVSRKRGRPPKDSKSSTASLHSRSSKSKTSKLRRSSYYKSSDDDDDEEEDVNDGDDEGESSSDEMADHVKYRSGGRRRGRPKEDTSDMSDTEKSRPRKHLKKKLAEGETSDESDEEPRGSRRKQKRRRPLEEDDSEYETGDEGSTLRSKRKKLPTFEPSQRTNRIRQQKHRKKARSRSPIPIPILSSDGVETIEDEDVLRIISFPRGTNKPAVITNVVPVVESFSTPSAALAKKQAQDRTDSLVKAASVEILKSQRRTAYVEPHILPEQGGDASVYYCSTCIKFMVKHYHPSRGPSQPIENPVPVHIVLRRQKEMFLNIYESSFLHTLSDTQKQQYYQQMQVELQRQPDPSIEQSASASSSAAAKSNNSKARNGRGPRIKYFDASQRPVRSVPSWQLLQRVK